MVTLCSPDLIFVGYTFSNTSVSFCLYALDLILVDCICQEIYTFLLDSSGLGIQNFQSTLLTNPLNCINICCNVSFFISNFVDLDILSVFWLVWLRIGSTCSFFPQRTNLCLIGSFYSFTLCFINFFPGSYYSLPAFGCLALFSQDFEMHYYLFVISIVVYCKHSWL